MDRRSVLTSVATGMVGVIVGCSSFDDTDEGVSWESIEELEIEIRNAEETEVSVSLPPDSTTEPFLETTLSPGETHTFLPLPFEGERPEGTRLEIDAEIQQDTVGATTTNEIIEFEEVACVNIQIDAVVRDEQVTAETTCE